MSKAYVVVGCFYYNPFKILRVCLTEKEAESFCKTVPTVFNAPPKSGLFDYVMVEEVELGGGTYNPFTSG